MKNLFFIGLLFTVVVSQQRSSYSWEDGTGTILGTYNPPVVDVANVGSSNGITPFDGSRMLTVSESPIGGTPQAFIAWVTDLSAGQNIEACFYGYDNTPNSAPSLRIWGNWSANNDITAYGGSADGNEEYTDGSGWDQVCYTFSTNDEDWDNGEALVIQARLYSSSSGSDPSVYYIDLVEVTAPNGVTVNYPGGSGGLSGCMDNQACNYNQFAAEDDGSCIYPMGSISIYDLQYTSNQGEYCYESEYDQECWSTSGVVTAVSPEFSNFYIQDSCPSSGDVNGDSGWNVLDVVLLANWVLDSICTGVNTPANCCSGDLNVDGGWNVLDVVGLANCVLSETCDDGSGSSFYSGIYVHGYTASQDSPIPNLGDNIAITATVNEFYSLTQLLGGSSYLLNSTGNTTTPIEISTEILGAGCSEEGESVESMLVRITNVEVTTASNEYGEWYVSDGVGGSVMINDKIFDGEDWPNPSVGQEFAVIQGVVDYAYSEFSILPRTASDIALCSTCPVANAGSDQFVPQGATVTLNGSGSFDPDGSIISYEWQQQSGTAVSLSDEEAEITTFIAPNSDGDLVFSLVVYDNDFIESAPDEITITIGSGTSIQDIQCPNDLSQGTYCYETSLEGEEVSLNGIVTHVLSNDHSSVGNFFLQQEGINSCAGIYIRDFDILPLVGDELSLTGVVNEYYSFTQIIDVTSSSIVSTANNILPLEISTVDLGINCSQSGEFLEGMLVKVSNVTVESIDEYGNLIITDGSGSTVMDDYYFNGSWPSISVGNTFTSIVGVVGYSYSEFKIYPRSSNDIVN